MRRWLLVILVLLLLPLRLLLSQGNDSADDASQDVLNSPATYVVERLNQQGIELKYVNDPLHGAVDWGDCQFQASACNADRTIGVVILPVPPPIEITRAQSVPVPDVTLEEWRAMELKKIAGEAFFLVIDWSDYVMGGNHLNASAVPGVVAIQSRRKTANLDSISVEDFRVRALRRLNAQIDDFIEVVKRSRHER